FARKCPACRLVHVLCRHFNVREFKMIRRRREIDKSRRYDHAGIGVRRDAIDQFIKKIFSLLGVFMHFPVSGNYFLSHLLSDFKVVLMASKSVSMARKVTVLPSASTIM